MTEEQALLAAVRAAPDDDLPRLVYADWLDDQENPAATARALFIRAAVQLENVKRAAKNRRQRSARRKVHAAAFAAFQIVGRVQELDLKPCADHGHPYRFLSASEGSVELEWSRGLVHIVRCNLSDWCGRNCLSCHGDGQIEYPEGEHRCHQFGCDSGRIGAIGPAVVAAHPISQVVLAGREPAVEDGRYCWNVSASHNWRIAATDYSVPMAPDYLPGAIGNHLPGTPKPDMGEWVFSYPTREAALSASSAALIAWAKEQSGRAATSTILPITPPETAA